MTFDSLQSYNDLPIFPSRAETETMPILKKAIGTIKNGLFACCALIGCSLSADPLVSIYAVDCHTGKVLIDQNSDVSMTPASCLKVLTTGAALELLGKDHRFETRLEYEGTIDNHILHGNIAIRGGGDPCLGSDRIAGVLSWKEQLSAWADAVVAAGITTVEGKVIGDASRWELALAVPSWTWEDVGNYYGAGACALSFHENFYTLFFEPGIQVGDPAPITRTDPPVATLVLQNEVKTGPQGSGDQACIYGSEFSLLQCIRGTIPAAVKEFSIKGSIPDPTAYTAELLQQELEDRGVVILNKEIAAQQRSLLIETRSPTVEEIAHWTNQKSINLYAEHLLKGMGEVYCKEGSTASGIKALTDFWDSQGIDLKGAHLVDGSGLSRQNLLTTKQLVRVLTKMKKSPSFPSFLDSLPPREGGIRAKSGSMKLVRGYAGYAGEIAFALLINQCPDSKWMQEKVQSLFSKLITLSEQPQAID